MPIARPPACIVSLLALLIVTPAAAEDEPAIDGHHIDVAAGLGLSYPTDNYLNGRGEGGFLQAAYVFLPHSAVTPRAYAGLLITFPDRERCSTQCDIEAKIAFFGAKLRAMAPIPWVGPYIELGLGISAGYLRTFEGPVDKTTRGLSWHVPVALGVALGQRHQYDVSFSYLFQPEEEQVGGAVAIGVGFVVP